MNEPHILTLPTELLILILCDACGDSSKSDCTLSLVCKAFRNVCVGAAIDIQSVALCGADQMCQFLDVLDGRPKQARRVRSLFVSTSSPGEHHALRANKGEHVSVTYRQS